MKSYIMGVKIDQGMSMGDVIASAHDSICRKKPQHFCTTNPEFIMAAQKDLEFSSIINASDLSLPDGAGVLYALRYLQLVEQLDKNSRLFKLKAFLYGLSVAFASQSVLGEKIIGVSLFLELCKLAEKEQFTIFLLGGRIKDFFGKPSTASSDLATMCKNELIKLYPHIRIIGATSQFSSEPKDDDATLKYIHECMEREHVDHVDMLFVAYNHPKQDLWLHRNKSQVPALLSMAVGGTFDYVAGTKKRAPSILINMNLEWLYKLVTQPWRMKRIYIAFPLFPFRLYKSVIK